MKERIIKKLEDYADSIILKDDISSDDAVFLFNFLCRIDTKELAEKQEREREEEKKKMAEKMSKMFEGGF